MVVAVQPMNLLFALIGVLLGTAVGVLPGIGPALTVALLLPVTYKLDPAGSLIMFAGLLRGLIGIDKLTGQARLSFGVPELLDGIEVTTLAVGLFAVGEALYVASRRHHEQETLEPVRGSLWMTKDDWKRSTANRPT